MSRAMKAIFLMSIFSDDASKLMIFMEWFRNDSNLDLRFQLAIRREVIG